MRRMTFRTAGAVLAGVLTVLCTIPAFADTTATRKSTLAAPFITGSFTDASGGQGVFQGHLKFGTFEARGADVVSTGELTGLLADSQGEAVSRVGQSVSWTVTSVAGGCDSIQLTLAATELTLGSTNVKLDAIVLDVSATQQGRRARQLICETSNASKNASAPGDLAGRLSELFRVLR